MKTDIDDHHIEYSSLSQTRPIHGLPEIRFEYLLCDIGSDTDPDHKKHDSKDDSGQTIT